MASLPMGRARLVLATVLTGSVLLASGCASGDSEPDTTSTSASAVGETPPPSSSSAAVPEGTVVTASVENGKVTVYPGPPKVAPGQPIKLTVTSDQANELHVHGLDIEQELKAGDPVVLDLAFPDPGVYEIELHDPSLLLMNVTVGSVGG